jgi:hypothetical protein
MKLKYIFIISLFSTALSAQITKDSIQNVEQINLLVKKKLLERKADRLIFNVEASVASQGMDASETLANVPMLKVDENMGSNFYYRKKYSKCHDQWENAESFWECPFKLPKIYPLRKYFKNRSDYHAAFKI